MPHGHCYLWDPWILWLHVIANCLIVLAYCSIPFGLFYFVRQRKDLIYKPVFVLFGMFILCCAATHAAAILTIWHPYYVLEGVILLITGIVSLASAVVLFRLIPEALRLPNPQELRKTREELAQEAKMKAEAEAANLMKSQFLAHMSHEIRTPLNGLLGSVELLNDDPSIAERHQTEISIAQRSGHNLLEIINDVLDLSKIEAGKFELRNEPFDLKFIVANAIDLCRTKARSKSLGLSVEWDDDLPPCVLGDPTRVSQILTNLVTNAIKYTDEGNIEVTVHTEEIQETEACVSISVADSGVGIPADRVDAIFSSFHQAHHELARDRGGAGLGLAIANELAQKMGGGISVDSTIEKGSTFTATLRFAVPQAGGLPSSGPQRARVTLDVPGDRTPLRILIAEDNAPSRHILKRMLDTERVEIDLVDNGVDAVGHFKNNSYDFIIMDVRMPQMDGLTATKQIREIEGPNGAKRVPILVLTAYAMTGDHDRALSAGADDYLSKPYNRNDLIAKVNELARRREQV